MILRLLSICALLLVVGYLGVSSTHRNEGEFTYALDDTYIHLAVAKNLGAHGTWGINPGEFSSCTSSILWPLLLALFGAAMPWGEQVPLALNLLAGVVSVSVRQLAAPGTREPFHQAFMLPPSPALKSAGALVLPPMWFRAERVIEVRDGEALRQVCLRKLLLRGNNFDQCSFELVDPTLSPA